MTKPCLLCGKSDGCGEKWSLNGYCSPECARTRAIVDALDRLTVRPIRSALSVEIGEALDDPHNAVFNKRSEPKRL